MDYMLTIETLCLRKLATFDDSVEVSLKLFMSTTPSAASYPMDTRGSFPGGKVAGAWGWLFTSI
jgi:hypothetical protein